MLNYTFNINNFKNSKLSVDSMSIEKPAVDKIKSQLSIVTKDSDKFNLGDKLSVNTIFRIDRNIEYVYSKSYEVTGINGNNVTGFLPTFMRLNLWRVIISENGEWVFYFNEKHLFRDSEKDIKLYISYRSIDDRFIKKELTNVTYVTPEVLKFDPNNASDVKEEIESLFNNEKGGFQFSIERLNILYSLNFDELKFNKDLTLDAIPVVIENGSLVDLETQDNIQEYFVEEETRKAINNIVEMEKDVYHPVFKDNNGRFHDIYRIIFNLHFRQHRGVEWTLEDGTFWNGIDNESKDFDDGFLSYKNSSNQSDLLTYLGFTDADVKYQKNKLKKSFIRLGYYDDFNNANQNLLNYSTVFFNTGELFKKYIKHISDKPYKSMMMNKDKEELREDLIGIKVNREPTDELLNNSSDYDTIEDYRLSSQFKIYDKYSSTNSSEGFYLYLWKINGDGVVPKDLYMKVEFNHAGYGRTIPFMMPYDENDNERPHIIKTFEDILKDWEGENSGYNIRQFNKYSYIHLKYQYDIVKNRYVYYVDNDYYGDGSSDLYYDKNTNTLYFNLYEVKIDVNAVQKKTTKKLAYRATTEMPQLSYNTVSKEGGSTFPIFNGELENAKFLCFVDDNDHILVKNLPSIGKSSLIYTIINVKNTIKYIYEWVYEDGEWNCINRITMSMIDGHITTRENKLGKRMILEVALKLKNRIISKCKVYQE